MIKITKIGRKPATSNLTTEQALLISAWAYGLKENEKIHRLALFAFVQSHIKNDTEEDLQRFINNNKSNWAQAGDGYYKLLSSGFTQIQRYGTPNFILPTNITYKFKRTIDSNFFSVEVGSIDRGYLPKLNEQQISSEKIIDRIVALTNEYIPTAKTSKPRKIFNWILGGTDYEWKIETEVSSTPQISEAVIQKLSDLDEEEAFPEGKEKYRLHKSKERNQRLIALKKQNSINKNNSLPCEICDFSFKDKYGNIGEGFIEAHHILSISDLTEETQTKLEDLILVCSNCHKMIHRKRPWLTVEQMKNLIEK